MSSFSDQIMRFLLLALLFLVFHPIYPQEPVSLFEKLSGHKSISINLTYTFDSLYKTNRDEIEATIDIWTDSVCFASKIPLSLSLRGKFRRMKCTMPPLLLNFKKSTLRELELSSDDEFKLVTHCLEGEEGFQNLQEELLAYQIYQRLTPYSYRTIWVHVTYCNSEAPDECISSAGILLEPDKVLAARLAVEEKKMYNIPGDSIHFKSYAQCSAFNFLIGNRDWSIASSRNAKLFYNSDSSLYYVVPYDFDYANIVGASYRRETLPQTMSHPFDRVYQGEYFPEKAGQILKDFLVYEKIIQETVRQADNTMDKERRKKIERYFDTWFEMVRKTKVKDLGYGLICPYQGDL